MKICRRDFLAAFPAGAAVTVARRRGLDANKVEEDQIAVTFPSACAGGESGRVLLYEIEATVDGRQVGSWKLAQELHFQPLGRIPAESRLIIGADEVPAGEKVSFRVTPVGFFHRGRPIVG